MLGAGTLGRLCKGDFMLDRVWIFVFRGTAQFCDILRLRRDGLEERARIDAAREPNHE
jgi:hypothetical protein